MHQRYSVLLFLLLAALLACTSNSLQTGNQQTAAADTSSDQPKSEAPTDSLSIDLLALQEQGLLQPTDTVQVPHDPVFAKPKSFAGIPLQTILTKFSASEKLEVSQTQVIFECEDGYSPSMPLEKLTHKHAYLATRDLDAPQGQDWLTLTKDGHATKIAPFYVVYSDVAASDKAYKWPYNLVRIRLVPVSVETQVLFPKDAQLVKGYELFRTNCFTCHSINGVGGKMGPELNYPKNVTEYWQPEHLKAFIKNPAAYRNDCKMPNLNLPDATIEEIIRYVGYMKDHKTLATR
jgi:mono/diheme cytochrome c family protein